MKMDTVCRKYGLPPKVAQILANSGITKLYPPQEEALKSGVLEGKNMVLAMPTASGKTLVAELAMLKSILHSNGRCLYVVPLRALAREKYEEFKLKYKSLKIKVGIATGDYDTFNPALAKYEILIATSEKVDSLLRHRAKWLSEGLTVAVIDEIHLIDDPGRGPTLEIVIARLRQINPSLQLLALSATIQNSREIARWLDGESVDSDWRPVPLKEGVYYHEKISFADETSRAVKSTRENELTALTMDTVDDKGQVLVFVNTRRSAQAVADTVAKSASNVLAREEKQQLAKISETIRTALGESTRMCRKLADCVERGVAFHHAGLHPAQRKAIEEGFRQGIIKVISATPTLAAGVDLPSRRTIIRDWRRYESRYGLQPIPILEYKQMAGRAGRPKYDTFGEAILIAKTDDEKEQLLQSYILAHPEPIFSKLAQEAALRTHVLASIATGYASTIKGMLEFLGQTFFGYQSETSHVAEIVSRIMNFLKCENMVTFSGGKFVATPFGESISRFYLDPVSGVILRNGLLEANTREATELGLLHLMTATPDMGTLSLRRGDRENLELFVNERAAEFFTPLPPYWEQEYRDFLTEVKTACMIYEWIDEIREEVIHEYFGVGPGDVRRLVDNVKWLFHCAYELAKLFKLSRILPLLIKLERRVSYGVKEELLGLVSLRGIGRVRGRSLYDAGYRNIADLKKADVRLLIHVPHIGKETAHSIKRQIARI